MLKVNASALRALMQERGLSVRKLARLARISPSTVQSALTEPEKMTLSTVSAFAEALSVPPLSLLTQEGAGDPVKLRLLEAWDGVSPEHRESVLQLLLSLARSENQT